MNKEYDKNIGIGDDYFQKMRIDADCVLQKLLENMVEKDSKEASMTIKIDVKFLTEFISDYNEFGEPCGGHDAITPAFTHKISSVMQVKDNAKGINYSKFLELHYDEESKKYILIPIKGAQQMNLFETEGEDDSEATDQPAADEQTSKMDTASLEGEDAPNIENAIPFAPENASEFPDEESYQTEDSNDALADTVNAFAQAMNSNSAEDLSEFNSQFSNGLDEQVGEYDYEEPDEQVE